MQPEPIKTDAEHEAALKEIERVWDAEQGTDEESRLEILIEEVEAYEDAHFPMSA